MKHKTLSPVYSLICGHIFMGIIIASFYGFGFYEKNTYFQWGPPITFFNSELTSVPIFYGLLGMMFIHQIITNWIAEVVYPWVINTIQNPRHQLLDYKKSTCLLIINFNSLYNQLHLAFLISGITSQVSFLIVLILADVITLTYVNYHYIKGKDIFETNSKETELQAVKVERDEEKS